MRLIKLRIKNIASLKGEHEINFSELQAQSSLFAITGETGAGKSTILNSIGLVLYGKVYKTNINQNDLVTLGEKEGQIELIFQSKGKLYYALWKARIRKQNGELYSTPQTPQREIYQIENENFSANKNIMTQRIEDLIGLDFDQFCKCIILNQGEFARFLTSSFSERKEILEKLYPGELFDSFSTELKKEKDDIEQIIKEIEIELHTIKGDGPTGETLKPLIEKLEVEYKESERWLTQTEILLFHFSSLETYHTKYTEKKANIDSLKTTLSKETSIFNEISSQCQLANEELQKLKEEQARKQNRWQELLKLEEALRNILENQRTVISNLNKIDTEILNSHNKQKNIQEEQTNWAYEDKKILLTIQIPLEVLKESSHSFSEIIDIKTQLNLLEQDLIAQREKLANLEDQGKQESAHIKDIIASTAGLPAKKENLVKLMKNKDEFQKLLEQTQRSKIRQEELNLLITKLENDQSDLTIEIEKITERITKLNEEIIPIQASLKINDLFLAIESCLNHSLESESKECPVCHGYLGEKKITELKSAITHVEVEALKNKYQNIQQALHTSEAEVKSKTQLLGQLTESIEIKNKDLELIQLEKLNHEVDILGLETGIQSLQREIWQEESLIKEKEKTELSIIKTRESYSRLKHEVGHKQESHTQLLRKHDSIKDSIEYLRGKDLIPYDLLKDEVKRLHHYLAHERVGEKITQEDLFVTSTLMKLTTTRSELTSEHTMLNNKSDSLSEVLEKELQGRSASDLINELQSKIKVSNDKTTHFEKEVKAQELKLKDAQSRLYTLDELIKEIDLQYSKELVLLKHAIPNTALTVPSSMSQTVSLFSDFNLSLSDPKELFIPIRNLLEKQKESLKGQASELKMNFASARARLDDWEKRQDRINLLSIKEKELNSILERKTRLYEVLGKDELRSFVLSLVEENLIIQTNIELQKLCQGRYEIIHQSRKMKMSPEFYVLDKFREAGLRKVSTLSGGETFMVSLAMALGLAEMTRGKAEIDTLFIDEGFGTLDADSLQDVLDMLKQIQTRGLMVGIISHVKELTQSLPVNLLVTKKQDGISSIGMILN